MITAIQSHQFDQNRDLVDSIYRLRKTIFADTLDWDVPVHGDQEHDAYDAMDPVYLVMTDENREKVFASMRLMPTTGPNLLHDVFAETIPDAANLSAPHIWECTRFCVDETLDRSGEAYGNIHASSLLLLGLCEFGMRSGITMIAANFDPAMRRVYNRSGCEVEVLGRADTFGPRPVCCGTFEVSARILRQMRAKLGIVNPIFRSYREWNQPDVLAA